MNEFYMDSKLSTKKDEYILLKMDYLQFYLPRILLLKFAFIKVLLENKETLPTIQPNDIPYIDVTESFLKYGK